jgi:hypothetical protein
MAQLAPTVEAAPFQADFSRSSLTCSTLNTLVQFRFPRYQLTADNERTRKDLR